MTGRLDILVCNHANGESDGSIIDTSRAAGRVLAGQHPLDAAAHEREFAQTKPGRRASPAIETHQRMGFHPADGSDVPWMTIGPTVGADAWRGGLRHQQGNP